jgi:hypothetical protein
MLAASVLAEDVVFVELRRLTVTGVPNYIHLGFETPRLCLRRWRGDPARARRAAQAGRKYEVDLRHGERQACFRRAWSPSCCCHARSVAAVN